MSVKQQAPERALAVYPDAAERARRLTSEGPLVVKVGGSIQDVPAQMAQVMGDAAALAAMGVAVVVVHGGGKAISAAMASAGLAPRFIAGQRYTDEATLAIAEKVLAQTVNAELCAMLSAGGARPAPLHSLGECVLAARRWMVESDLGLVGEVTAVRAERVRAILVEGRVPVIGPIALDEREASGGRRLNINADLAGGAVARALAPSRFVLVSDTAGVRSDPKDPATRLERLNEADVERLRASGAVDGGMLPKLHACFEAMGEGQASGGQRGVPIVDGRTAGALLRAALATVGEPIDGTWVTL